MKIFAIILGLMCSFQAAFAFEGFYLGGEGGGVLTEGKQKGETVGVSFDSVFTPIDLKQKLTHNSGQANLYAGYGRSFCCLYLGGEAFVQVNASEMKAQFTRQYSDAGPEEYTANTHSWMHVSNIQYGFDFRPGWRVTPLTLLYGRVGVSRANLRLKTNNSYSLVEFTEVGSLAFKSSAHHTKAALRLGGGVEHHISPRVTVRGDYIFTDYGKIHVDRSAAGVGSEGALLTLGNQTQSRLYQHSVLLGLSYYFSQSCLDCCLSPCATPLFCGFYLGGALGGFFASEKLQENAFGNHTFLAIEMPLTATSHVTDKSVQGMLFGGYGWQWCRLFLGAEIFGTGSARDALKRTDTNELLSFANESISLNTQLCISSWQGGIDFRPGWCLTPFTLLYGRIGTSYATIKSHTEATFQGNLVSDWNLRDKKTKCSPRATCRFGGGIEQVLCTNLHLRFDYCYTNYGEVKLNRAVSNLDAFGIPVFLNYSNTYRVSDHSLLLGLSYYFW